MKAESKWLVSEVERRAGMQRALLGEGRWRALRARSIEEICDRFGEIVAIRVVRFGGESALLWGEEDRLEWERSRAQVHKNDRMIEKLGAWRFTRYARVSEEVQWGRAQLGMWHERTCQVGVR